MLALKKLIIVAGS